MSCPVSVIIPVYNGELYLREAIDSVLQQTIPPAEIIVVDDGSEDGSSAVVQSIIHPSIQYRRQSNAGIGAARNLGIEQSTQPFLAFLDADDLWVETKLEMQWQLLNQQPHLAMVFGQVEQFYSPDRFPHLVDQRWQLAGIHPGAMLIRRSAFEQVGPFATRWMIGEFLDWYARAQEQGLQQQILNEVVMRRRIHELNQGTRHQDRRLDYVRVLRASLQRRRSLD